MKAFHLVKRRPRRSRPFKECIASSHLQWKTSAKRNIQLLRKHRFALCAHKNLSAVHRSCGATIASYGAAFPGEIFHFEANDFSAHTMHLTIKLDLTTWLWLMMTELDSYLCSQFLYVSFTVLLCSCFSAAGHILKSTHLQFQRPLLCIDMTYFLVKFQISVRTCLIPPHSHFDQPVETAP